MNKTNNYNSLEQLVFKDNSDFRAFESLLESLNHVIPKLVTRNEYNRLNGKYLVENGEDKFGKIYNLYLPKDLMKGELLEIILVLTKKFNLDNYSNSSNLITQTKIFVGTILREQGIEKGQEHLKSLAIKYNISNELMARISNEKINFDEAKKIIRKVKDKVLKNKLGYNNND